MNTVNINLEIDPANTKVAAALATLILVMGGGSKGLELAAAEAGSGKEPEETATNEKPKGTRKQTKVVPKPEETKDDADDAGDAGDDDDDLAGGTSLDDVRTNLGLKVSDNRNAIKAKLAKLGAKNVAGLDPKHYTTFNDFLLKL